MDKLLSARRGRALSHLTGSRKLLLVVVCCVAVAWLAGTAGRFLVATALLLIGPGYLIERLARPTRPASPLLPLALWPALSLSSIALLYAWTTALHLPLTPPVLGGLAVVCGAAVVWCAWRDTAPTDDAPPQAPAVPWQRSMPIVWAVLALVFALTLWNRASQVRDLVLPAWVDPVHHGLMMRVILEQGMAPLSLRPYLPVENLPYHWGYHVFQATAIQLSGVSLPMGMLWGGQLINALHALTCAALAAFFWRSPLAGIVAAIVVGLVSLFPSYYVSWGRYTHLTGLLVVPALAICWQAWLDTGLRVWLVRAVVLLAGLSIIHMLVLLLALCLVAVISVVWLLLRGADWPAVRSRGVHGFVGVSVSLVLAAPWLWVLVQRVLAPAVEKPQQLASAGDYVALHEGLLWAGQARLLVALALLAALWGFWRRDKAAAVMIGWVVVIAVLANPWSLAYVLPMAGAALLLWGGINRRLLPVGGGVLLVLVNPWFVSIPYVWAITNDVVVISLFIVLGVLIGGGAHLLHTRMHHIRSRRWLLAAQVGGVAVLVVASLWSTWQLRSVINRETVFVNRADRAAIAWVASNTPTDARFLINATYWYPDANRGVDGGYWLLTLTGRWISTPPSLFTRGDADYVQHQTAISQFTALYTPDQKPQLYDLIEQEGITHIYLREGAGPISLADFTDSLAFPRVYEQDGVVILAVR